MAELLLINPRKRRATAKRKTAKRRVRRNPIAVKAPARPPVRRRNPIGLRRVKSATRRRRNPISMNYGGIVGMLKDAAIGGAGSVAIDVVMGYINPMLPTSMSKLASAGTGTIGTYEAIKVAVTIAAGQLLSKPTKGLSKKLAAGALTVQAAEMLRTFVPPSMHLGYASPANIVRGSNRIGPIMSRQGMGAYISQGGTPLLNAYQSPGSTALLNGARTPARSREGFAMR
jgi:hypothetical protein